MQFAVLPDIEKEMLPEPEGFELDDFQSKVYHHMYFEIPIGNLFYLISPSLAIILPVEYSPGLSEEIRKKEECFELLRRLLIESLIKFTAILEANSYYIEQNEYLVIARFSDQISLYKYKINYYTHSPSELSNHYEDKLYIGHDYLYLKGERRYYGLDDFIRALSSEYKRLEEKGRELLPASKMYEKTFMVEIKDLIEETSSLWRQIKKDVDINTLPLEELKAYSNNLIELKHMLIELLEEVKEFEQKLRSDGDRHFVRYMTKYHKDVVNILHYINMKLLSRIQQRINVRRPV